MLHHFKKRSLSNFFSIFGSCPALPKNTCQELNLKEHPLDERFTRHTPLRMFNQILPTQTIRHYYHSFPCPITRAHRYQRKCLFFHTDLTIVTYYHSFPLNLLLLGDRYILYGQILLCREGWPMCAILSFSANQCIGI